jgi:hypothetical protein
MPCYTNQTATVQFGKNTDAELLRLALASQGLTADNYIFNRESGELTTFRAVNLSALKQAYSEQVITQTAKRNGWQLQWTVNASGNRQAEVLRVSR